MRESVGTTWTFTIVLTFTFIFTGFLILAINYARAYRVKNELTTIIEKYEGITTEGKNSLEIMNNFLINNHHNAIGACPIEEEGRTVYGVEDLNSNIIDTAEEGKRYHYCISYEINENDCTAIYYITVFYDFNLPVFGQLRKFKIKGQTNEIPYARFKDELIMECTRSYN